MFSQWWSVLLIVLWENHYKAEEYRLRNIREPGPYPVCTWDGEMEGLCFLYLVVTMLFKYLIGNNLLWRSEYHFFQVFLWTTDLAEDNPSVYWPWNYQGSHTGNIFGPEVDSLKDTAKDIFFFGGCKQLSLWQVSEKAIWGWWQAVIWNSSNEATAHRVHSQKCTAHCAEAHIEMQTTDCEQDRVQNSQHTLHGSYRVKTILSNCVIPIQSTECSLLKRHHALPTSWQLTPGPIFSWRSSSAT